MEWKRAALLGAQVPLNRRDAGNTHRLEAGVTSATVRFGNMITVIPATAEHHEAVWHIFHEVIQGGDAYVFPEDMSREDALAYWFAPAHHPYVAVAEDGRVLGSYILKPNQPGRGAHVANGSYMTASRARGMGIGGLMAAHSVEEAARLGYRAIQYNIVVSTNDIAVRLWQRHGFKIVGTLPKAFRHKELGYVDAYVMHRFVGGGE